MLDLKKFYVGSTTVNCHSRQDARIRKYRLLKEGQFTNTELMVHYFHVHSDLFDAIMIPLTSHKSAEETRAQECAFIYVWKPQLNAPWIVKLNPTSATRTTSLTLNATIYATPGKRLWMKVRRRMYTMGILNLYPVAPVNPYDNWNILVQLARGGMQTFEAEKTLRSAQFHSQHIYALLRVTMLLDDPPKNQRTSYFEACPQISGLPRASTYKAFDSSNARASQIQEGVTKMDGAENSRTQIILSAISLAQQICYGWEVALH